MARLTLLGVQVDPLTIAELNQLISHAIARGGRVIIANHNLHSVYLHHRDGKMRTFFQCADVAHIDGMPLLYWARVLGYRVTKDCRVTYVDWIHPLVEVASSSGWRVFYLGGKPRTVEKAAAVLCKEYPRLQLATHHGYFSPQDDAKVLEEIAAHSTQILMVGMGMPRQEHWVLDNLGHIHANAILTAGACFDYIAGAIPTPPRWMGRIGLEWLCRLVSEPRRLWRRYLLEPWYLAPWFLRDIWRCLIGAR